MDDLQTKLSNITKQLSCTYHNGIASYKINLNYLDHYCEYNHMIQQGEPVEDNDMLCQFTNLKEEHLYTIKSDIYIESQNSLRHDQSPNPNKTFRIARSIYQNYVTLTKSVKNFRAFLLNYRAVLVINAQRKRLKALQNLSAQDQMKKAQYDQAILPMIINKIVLLKEKQEKQAISYAINKLKCMVIKARYKESTMLQYLTQTYVTKLKNTLIYHIRYSDDKVQKSKLIELESARNQFIYKAIQLIKKRYDVVQLKRLSCYKVKPTAYLNEIKRKAIEEKPVFFINFFTESLLFVDQSYINFSQSLLFCPIVFSGHHTLKISDYYLQKCLVKMNEYVQFQLYVQVYHMQTASEVPVFYSKLIDIPQNSLVWSKQLPERMREQMRRFEKLLDHIDAIRRCVFGKMILHWLCTLFNSQNNSVEMIFQEKFKVVIYSSTQARPYECKKDIEGAQFSPEIMANIILFAEDRKNVQKGRRELKQGVRAQIEATIFKLISQKVLNKASWPLQCYSLGQYYYEYSSERIISRPLVKKFFSQF